MKSTFNQIFEECHTYCITNLIKLTNSKAEAEDLFSDAIAKYWVYSQQGKIKHQENVKAFVFVTAKRLWLDQKRKKQKEYYVEESKMNLHLQQQMDSSDMENFNILIDAEDKATADKNYQTKMKYFQIAFEQLEEKYQKLLKNRYVYNLSTQEIAEQFGFKSSRVAITTIFRCKQKFLKIYGAQIP